MKTFLIASAAISVSILCPTIGLFLVSLSTGPDWLVAAAMEYAFIYPWMLLVSVPLSGFLVYKAGQKPIAQEDFTYYGV